MVLLDVTDKGLLCEYYAKLAIPAELSAPKAFRSWRQFALPSDLAGGLGDAIERAWRGSQDWLAALLPELTM